MMFGITLSSQLVHSFWLFFTIRSSREKLKFDSNRTGFKKKNSIRKKNLRVSRRQNRGDEIEKWEIYWQIEDDN